VKWLSLTYGNVNGGVVYNQEPGYPTIEETQYSPSNTYHKDFGDKICQIGDYIFVRFWDDLIDEHKIRVLKNDMGVWGIDTTLTYQGPHPHNGIAGFGFYMVADTCRVAIGNHGGALDHGDVSIYKKTSNGFELEQIIDAVDIGEGIDLYGETLVTSKWDTVQFYELNNNDVWEHKLDITGLGQSKPSLWNDRLVLHSTSAVISFYRKIGNVWGVTQTISSPAYGFDMYEQFYVYRYGPLHIYKYDNGTYHLMTNPPQIDEYSWSSFRFFGDYLILGHPAYDNDPNTFQNDGIVRIMKYNGSDWEFVQDIFDPFPGNSIGTEVSTDGVNYVIGAPSADVNGVSNAGKILIGPVLQS
ncbi:MAG: hypothetical protein AAGK97_15125, partial [Bacteroidota bacterium]